MKRHLRAAIKPVSALADRLAPPPASGLTVLAYHRVGAGSGSEVDLDRSLFEEQVAHLRETGRVVTLDDGLRWLAGSDLGFDDPVAITFDDGTPDVFEIALPVLEQAGLPMTLYLATRFVEDGLPFWRPSDAPLRWSAIADALTTGLVTVGSHTHSHALLDRLDEGSVADELDRSRSLIQERLGVPAEHFAYPKALAPTAEARAAVAARFRSAALAGTRRNAPGADPLRLARSPIQRSDGMRWFLRKLDGGLGLEDRLRDELNRRRYAGATS